MLFRFLLPDPPCPVRAGHCVPLDVVDFHKTCVEEKGLFMSLSGIPVYYFLCEQCGFVFAPEFSSWTPADFGKYIYNAQYAEIDPDFKTVRPEINAQGLLKLFPQMQGVTHLDYGGGAGYLSELLRGAGWDSRTYDPYAGEHRTLPPGARFQLMTSFEVFEHVPDPVRLLEDLGKMLDDDGVLFFSTELSDGRVERHKRIDWGTSRHGTGTSASIRRKACAAWPSALATAATPSWAACISSGSVLRTGRSTSCRRIRP